MYVKIFLLPLLIVLASPALAEDPPVATVEIDEPEPRGADDLPQGEELVNIDFPEPTEIKDIIKAVALWTGKNVILDRQVSGKVQIISPRKVTKEEAYQAFLSALNILGHTTVETGKVIKIMPIRTAVKGNLKTFMGSKWTPRTDEIITQIVPLKYIDAKNIQTTLSRIVSSNSMIAYQPTNTLIISDTGYKVRRVLDIIDLLDVQTQQPRLEIIPIRFSDAKSVAEKVRELVTRSSRRKRARSSGSQEYKILVDERSNSVIIFGPPRTITDVKQMVEKFDIELDDPSKQATIHVRPLDYADAKTLAATLSALTQSGNRRTTRSRRLSSALKSSSPPTVAQFDNNVKITAYEPSNSLLITGSRSAYQALNAIIRKLDMRRSQVYVEADILDININDSFAIGASIFAGAGSGDGMKSIGSWQGENASSLIVGSALANNESTKLQALESLRGLFASDGIAVGILSGMEVELPGLGKVSPGAFINLLKTDANTKVLATPQILTSNNEEAKIIDGETRLFYTEPLTATGAKTQKLEKQNADLRLKIKPNISHSNYVTMKIDLESTDFGTQDSAQSLPNLIKRQTSQIVTVKNGQTVVISGLLKTREFETFQKIPLLGDIPILGWLFRNSRLGSTKTNLVVFLKPYIVHSASDLAQIYKQKIIERDKFLTTVNTKAGDKFYSLLPTASEGEYRGDEIDAHEQQQLEEMRREMYRIKRDDSHSAYPLDGSHDAIDNRAQEDMQVNDAPIAVPEPEQVDERTPQTPAPAQEQSPDAASETTDDEGNELEDDATRTVP